MYKLTLIIIIFIASSCISSTTNKTKKQRFATKMSIELSVEDVSLLGQNAICNIDVFSSNCDIPPNDFLQMEVTYYLFAKTNMKDTLFTKTSFSIFLDENSCRNGVFETNEMIIFPASVFNDSEQEYVLVAKLEDARKLVRILSKPAIFTIKTQDSPQKEVSNTDDPYLFIKNPQEKIDKRYVSISFTGCVNPGSEQENYSFPDITADFYVLLYYKGKICSRKLTENLFTSFPDQKKLVIEIPYTNIFVPEGDYELSYKIFARTHNVKPQELHEGKVSITQPQLYWIDFSTKNVEINASGMDKSFDLVVPFSKKAGRGIGDVYYTLRNDKDLLFSSSHVRHSGNVNNQKGSIQTDLSEKLTVSFWDSDVIGADFIDEFSITTLSEGSNSINISQGKIINCDLTYKVYKVTDKNYDKLRTDLNRQ